MKDLDDGQLMEMLRSGSSREQAFRMLVDRYKERLYWHIRKLVISHEDTDDILQNVFVKIWQNAGSYRGESRPYTWMFRIATNEALNFLDEKRRKVFGNSGEITDALANSLESDPWFTGDDIQKELQRSLLGLTDRQRLIFNMKYFEGLSYEEMAAILQVAVGTLKATYHNAVRKVEESLRLADISN